VLSPFARADARYCGAACRLAAHREHAGGDTCIPADLRRRDRWVRHRAKRPITVDGRPASSTNPQTWTTWSAARDASTGDGAGFVLDTGIICIDIDHCLTPAGRLEAWAAPVLAQLPRTYIEVSPSGRGLHCWGTGELERGRVVKVEGGRLELYSAGRYMTVTGRRFRAAPSRLADLSGFIEVAQSW